MPSLDDRLRVRFENLLEPLRDDVVPRIQALTGRKRRRQRATILVLALAATVGGGTVLVRAFFSERPTPEPAAAPAVARATCDRNGITLHTPSVAAQRDGVHFSIHNTSEETLSFGGSLANMDVAPGHSTGVLSIGPGVQTISCLDSTRDFVAPNASADLAVIDAAGLWTPDDLECQTDGYIHDTPGTPFAKGTPESLVERHWDHLRTGGDSIRRAGYPDQAEPLTFVMTRDRRVARAELMGDGAGGWKIVRSMVCQEVWYDAPAEPGPTSSPGLNIDNIRVTGTTGDGTNTVELSFRVSWPGDEFPGVYDCTFIVLSGGREVGRKVEQVTTLSRVASAKVWVDLTQPNADTAEASCGDRKDVGSPYAYGFRNLRILDWTGGQERGTVEYGYTASWLGPNTPGPVACLWTFSDEAGVILLTRSNTYSAAETHPVTSRPHVTAPEFADREPTALEVECVPYVSEDQPVDG